MPKADSAFLKDPDDPSSTWTRLGSKSVAWAKRESVAAVLVGVIAATVIVSATGGHMALTADSVTYLSAAESLHGGYGLRTWLESPLVVFPPAWPVAVAALMYLGLSVNAAALVLIATSMIAVPVLVSALMRRVTSTVFVRYLATVAAALSPVVLSWGLGGLSEVPFIVLVLACSVAAARSVEGRPLWLIAAVFIGSVAPLIRYAGVGVPLGLALWVFLVNRGIRRWILAASSTGIGLLPLGLLTIRNVVEVDAPFGVREPSTLNPIEVLRQGLSGMGRTVLWGLDAAPGALELLLGTAVFVLVALTLVDRGLPRSPLEPQSAERDPTAVARPVRRLLAILVVAQWLVMVGGRVRAEIDDLGPRLLAPTAVLVLVLLFAIAGDCRTSASVAVRRVVAAGLVGWCVIGVLASVRFVMREDAKGYEQPSYGRVRSSEALAAIPAQCRHEGFIGDPEALEPCDVLANVPWLWYLSDLRPHISPRSFGDAHTGDLSRLDRSLADGGDIYLLWTDLSPVKSYLMDLDELRGRFDLVPISSDHGLAVYRLKLRG